MLATHLAKPCGRLDVLVSMLILGERIMSTMPGKAERVQRVFRTLLQRGPDPVPDDDTGRVDGVFPKSLGMSRVFHGTSRGSAPAGPCRGQDVTIRRWNRPSIVVAW